MKNKELCEGIKFIRGLKFDVLLYAWYQQKLSWNLYTKKTQNFLGNEMCLLTFPFTHLAVLRGKKKYSRILDHKESLFSFKHLSFHNVDKREKTSSMDWKMNINFSVNCYYSTTKSNFPQRSRFLENTKENRETFEKLHPTFVTLSVKNFK